MCVLYHEEDFWKQFAAVYFKVKYTEVTEEQRKEAKLAYYRAIYSN